MDTKTDSNDVVVQMVLAALKIAVYILAPIFAALLIGRYLPKLEFFLILFASCLIGLIWGIDYASKQKLPT